MYSAGRTNYRKCESCCVSPVQHFPLKQVLISANLSKIVRPVAKELLKTNSPLANLVTIALTVPLVIASCFSPPIFQDHTYTYIHAVDVIQLVGVHTNGELITARLHLAFYATVHQPYVRLQNNASSFHPHTRSAVLLPGRALP